MPGDVGWRVVGQSVVQHGGVSVENEALVVADLSDRNDQHAALLVASGIRRRQRRGEGRGAARRGVRVWLEGDCVESPGLERHRMPRMMKRSMMIWTTERWMKERLNDKKNFSSKIMGKCPLPQMTSLCVFVYTYVCVCLCTSV